ncbi:MAG: NAD(P)-binding protein [Lachnospiraceae bacterium]|jgi:Protoporphyrinogen oxidase|nr:NAD(P)-binding protein [Lachnospiraceae bacterium]
MKIAVLGAGVSGLTAARLLKDKEFDVTVYEQNEAIGGLARTRYTDGYLYDPYGGHIFNSKHKNIVDWIFSLLPQNLWQYTERNAKIYFQGRYVSYPFELSLCELETEDAVNCIYDFLLSQNGPEPDNFEDWLIWNFGKSIAEAYMLPYNSKIWSYPLKEMETKWMQGKMPLPAKKEILRSMLLKDPKERKMPHSTFYYPIDGGIQSMVNAIGKGVTVHCNTPVQCIEYINQRWFVNGDGPYDQVISTIPLPVVNQVMVLPENIKDAVLDLKYNSLTTILFDCPKTDITWLYIPSDKYRSHRVGYQSTLTPHACPNQENRGCGSLEIIGKKFEVTKQLLQSNILPEELGFREIIDSEFTEYAYVIHDLNYRKNVTLVKKYFDNLPGFQLLGRWGTWNYKNMDLCMLDAFQLVESMGEEYAENIETRL